MKSSSKIIERLTFHSKYVLLVRKIANSLAAKVITSKMFCLTKQKMVERISSSMKVIGVV